MHTPFQSSLYFFSDTFLTILKHFSQHWAAVTCYLYDKELCLDKCLMKLSFPIIQCSSYIDCRLPSAVFQTHTKLFAEPDLLMHPYIIQSWMGVTGYMAVVHTNSVWLQHI